MNTPERFTLDSGTDIPLLWYRGQPVLTFALIDRVHQRTDGRAKKTFYENRDRFIAGEDFHLVDFAQRSEFRTFGIEVPPRGLTVVTESGYLMLVKSFSDDLAWQVQRQLINGYFRARRIEATPPAGLPNLFPGADQPPTARLDAALLRELRLISPALAQVYLVEMGITPEYVAGVLDRRGLALAATTAPNTAAGTAAVMPNNAAPLHYLRERLDRMADFSTAAVWIFLPDTWAAVCQPYDARDTLIRLRELGYLLCAPNRFTRQGPRQPNSRRRPACYHILKRLAKQPTAATVETAPSTETTA
ncbi:ORF6N domain-containing protein [Plasticicumulans sp.]|uniref:ORF6N domain-containing protein n=1 Tax=Plasticicumulans sp. TaxID=2307179 RepID=UPI00395BB31A